MSNEPFYVKFSRCLKLLFVPLLESQFLLHLPDLYHELAHPIIVHENDPLTEPFRHSLVQFINEVIVYINAQITRYRRKTGPHEFQIMLNTWRHSWLGWTIELFCDLFAVFTLGPAYAWSHMHLTIKFGTNPYAFKRYEISSHPPDNVRMKAILLGLQMMNFESQSKEIEEKWNSALTFLSHKPEPEYNLAFPDHIVEQCVVRAFEGISKIDCRIANECTNDRIHALLNNAWETFWSEPDSYPSWEREEVNKLRSELLA
ncbi:MAG: hypothetical protein HWN70_02225 [Desulfobacterales bacterium]|nr:hypothetical protein [Desulfobacterales bacterium]